MQIPQIYAYQMNENAWQLARYMRKIWCLDTQDHPRMTWRERLDWDMKDMGLRPGMAIDRESSREVEVWHHEENL